MNSVDIQLRGVGDVRLAVHAASSQPAWLWSLDGTRVLWANPVGARLFGARNSAALSASTFGPADQHRRQVAQLGIRLPSSGAVRLERLRGFGAGLGSLMTCACSRLGFADGGAGVLVVASAPPGRGMPLAERLQNLVEGMDTPIAAFARDGVFIGASDAARAMLGFRNLTDAGLDTARSEALKDGRVETPIGFGHMVLQRVGSGADVGLVALIVPNVATQPVAAAPAPVQPAINEPPVAPATDLASVVDVDPALAERVVEQVQEEVYQETVETPADDHHEPVPSVDPTLPPAGFDDPQPIRSKPLRFTWQMDADTHFTIGSDDFTKLLGPQTASLLGRPWGEITTALNLDPEGHVAKAIASRNPWSGIALQWPVDGGMHLPVELAGLPVIDRERNLAGYRGFGLCSDLDALTRLDTLRQHDLRNHVPVAERPLRSLSADIAQAGPAPDIVADIVDEPGPPDDPQQHLIEPIATLPSPDPTPSTDPEHPVDTPKNVVHFRPGDTKSPVLTPVENSAFNELARQLSVRLQAETALTTDEPAAATIDAHDHTHDHAAATTVPDASNQRDWLDTHPKPAQGETARDRVLFDLLPVAVLIYRLDRLLYANPAFLARIGYPTLQALEEAGGLDALYVEPDVSGASSTSDAGTAVRISAAGAKDAVPAEARLHTIAWDNEPAHALIATHSSADRVAADAGAAESGATVAPVAELPPGGAADAEELATILDTTAEGIVMFDADGKINSCNRSAEALFGYAGDALTQRNLVDLFAPESHRVISDYLDGIKSAGVASLLDHGREALAQVRGGGLIPLSMTMGRTRDGGPNFFAVFRDLTQAKKTETELLNARRQADRAATAKADVLARISHEVRTPLNAIIGFSEVMTDERFGPLGNERYVEYMKDIRGSGERVISIINDLLDLSRIETGKLDLVFTTQNLNEMVEQCVAVMQPQANRGRIIIRTSLAHLLPTVVADARALRQIALNLIGNSIHLANAGGQVIVSTALSDFGDVVLRVRDTGHGMNDNELAAAMEPFHTQAPADQSSESSGVSLSLTKALVEANRARFQIKTAPSSGTLIEVVFTNAVLAKA